MLAGSEIMPGSPAGQRAAAQAALAKRGVLVVHNSMVGRALPALVHACLYLILCKLQGLWNRG